MKAETSINHYTPPDAKHLLADSAYYIRENSDNTYSVVRRGSHEIEMITSTKAICEEWIANRV